MPYMAKFWISQGFRNFYRHYFPKEKFLKPNEIPNCYDKVQELIKSAGYSEDEAIKFVIVDESIKRGKTISWANPPKKEKDEQLDSSDWISILGKNLFSSGDIDLKELMEVINFCFNQLKNRSNIRHLERDFEILYRIILLKELQYTLANEFELSEPSITTIKNRDLPIIQRCVKNEIDPDSTRRL
ncbi:MAG: hypothetical protein JRD71_00035 [Deltaproteobacteria bacterium]|nr:hypothetical protein [Deltaproteobacteria bacterium]